MRQADLLLFGGALLAISACATDTQATQPEGPVVSSTIGPPVLAADVRDGEGRSRASARVEQAGDGVRVRVEAMGMSPGTYGVHLHMVGRCDGPAFATAGPHWNPTGHKHGKDNPQGMHKGDLPNLTIGGDGRGSFEYAIPGATLSGMSPQKLIDEDGAAVVIHSQPDDYRTDPSGNSGDRIACGVLG